MPTNSDDHAAARFPLRNHPLDLDALRDLRPLVRSSASQMEDQGRLTDEVVAGLARAGAFGLLVPKCLGGSEAHPTAVMDVLSDLAYTDGSTGWTTMAIATATGVAGAYLGDDAIKMIFDGPGGYTCAGTTQPRGRAEKVPDGYQIEGAYSFGSGTAHASWILCGYIDATGATSPLGDGQASPAMGVTARSTVDIMDNWDVLGLRATASNDFQIKPHVVDEDFIATMIDPRPKRGGALYNMGFKSLGALGHGSIPLGIGQRALDELTELSQRKKNLQPGVLIDKPTFQRDFADMTAAIRSARSYLRDAFSRLYEAAERGPVGLDLRAEARLAASHAVKAGVAVAQFAYLAGGSDSLRDGSVIQRCFRDMHAASQHAATAQQTFIDAGSVLLGSSSRVNL
jgi:alkylation response protein AidB-like acyl-CoA dehydrogenase